MTDQMLAEDPHPTGWPRPLAEVFSPRGDRDLLLLWATPTTVIPRDPIVIANALHDGTEASSVNMGAKAGTITVRTLGGHRFLTWTSPDSWDRPQSTEVELTEWEARNLGEQLRARANRPGG